jgi:hypothetical protein
VEVAVPASAVVVAWAVAVDLGASEYDQTGDAYQHLGDLIGGFTAVKGALNTRSVGLEAPLVR